MKDSLLEVKNKTTILVEQCKASKAPTFLFGLFMRKTVRALADAEGDLEKSIATASEVVSFLRTYTYSVRLVVSLECLLSFTTHQISLAIILVPGSRISGSDRATRSTSCHFCCNHTIFCEWCSLCSTAFFRLFVEDVCVFCISCSLKCASVAPLISPPSSSFQAHYRLCYHVVTLSKRMGACVLVGRQASWCNNIGPDAPVGGGK